MDLLFANYQSVYKWTEIASRLHENFLQNNVALITAANESFILCSSFCLVMISLSAPFQSSLIDKSKAASFLIGRLVYFCLFHPLAKFSGPLLAKIGDGSWYYALLSGRGPWMNHDWHKKYGWFPSYLGPG